MSREIIVQTTEEILAKAGFQAHTQWSEGQVARVCISSAEDISGLIGKDGQNLGALEHLVRILVAKKLPHDIPLPDFMVDVNDYRKSYTEELISIARESAKRVLETGRAESLSPMNAFERKLIHTELASFGELQTQSIGTEPNRRVVIKRASL